MLEKQDVIILNQSEQEYVIEEILQPIDEGKEMGTYLVKETDTGQYYVIKACYAENEAMKNNINREANFRFYYPFIEHVYGSFYFQNKYCEDAKYYGLKAEYIEGWDLCKFFDDDHEKDESLRFRLILQLLQATKYYIQFAKDIFLHRDIKPENIMVTKGNRNDIKIIDFDYAHITKSNRTVSVMKGECEKPTSLGFSPGYSDPVIRKIVMPTIKEELYSIGLVIFYILTGTHYFSNSEKVRYEEDFDFAYTFDEKKLRHHGIGYEDTRYDALKNILKKTIAKPENRYKSIEELYDDFLLFLERFYGSKSDYYQALNIKEMPLLQPNQMRWEEEAMKIKYCIQGEKSRAKTYLRDMHLYAMVDIRIEGKLAVTIYNLDNRLCFIPYENGFKREKAVLEEDYCIRNHDVFLFDDKRIEFVI